MNEFKGFSLFNDIEDAELRNRNRSQVLCNITEDHSKDRRISPKGAALIIEYFQLVDPKDRQAVTYNYGMEMIKRGWHLVANAT